MADDDRPKRKTLNSNWKPLAPVVSAPVEPAPSEVEDEEEVTTHADQE